jgi:hypothetical protein
VSRKGECHRRLGTQPRIDLDPVFRLLGSRCHAGAKGNEKRTGVGAQRHRRAYKRHALFPTDGSQAGSRLSPSDGPVCRNGVPQPGEVHRAP